MLVAPLVVVLSLIAGCGDGAGSEVDGDGYSYSAPSDWIADSPEAREIAEGEIDSAGVPGLDADTVSVDSDEIEGFASNVNVLTPFPADGLSADEAIELSIEGLTDPATPGASFDLTSAPSAPESLALDGSEAAVTEYGISRDDTSVGVRQMIAIHDDQAYFITFTALDGELDSELPEFEAILDSWSWE